jgi:hypothetical protein
LLFLVIYILDWLFFLIWIQYILLSTFKKIESFRGVWLQKNNWLRAIFIIVSRFIFEVWNLFYIVIILIIIYRLWLIIIRLIFTNLNVKRSIFWLFFSIMFLDNNWSLVQKWRINIYIFSFLIILLSNYFFINNRIWTLHLWLNASLNFYIIICRFLPIRFFEI